MIKIVWEFDLICCEKRNKNRWGANFSHTFLGGRAQKEFHKSKFQRSFVPCLLSRESQAPHLETSYSQSEGGSFPPLATRSLLLCRPASPGNHQSISITKSTHKEEKGRVHYCRSGVGSARMQRAGRIFRCEMLPQPKRSKPARRQISPPAFATRRDFLAPTRSVCHLRRFEQFGAVYHTKRAKKNQKRLIPTAQERHLKDRISSAMLFLFIRHWILQGKKGWNAPTFKVHSKHYVYLIFQTNDVVVHIFSWHDT